MKGIVISIVENTIFSTSIFFYLILKAKVRRKFICTDNILIIASSTLIGSCIHNLLSVNNIILIVLVNPFLTVFLIACLTIFNLFRDPERYHNGKMTDILSPADGLIIYLKRLEKHETPFSVKGKTISRLQELTKVDILQTPCWLIGIVMTLFDVHVIRAPTYGRVILNKHFKGKFISLKKGESDLENERNTIVLENELCQIGIIQIASKRVKDIQTYIKTGQNVEMGQRIGRIKFGSQTDIVFPINAEIKVKIGQWVYGGKTIIATMNKK